MYIYYICIIHICFIYFIIYMIITMTYLIITFKICTFMIYLFNNNNYFMSHNYNEWLIWADLYYISLYLF